MKFKDATKLPLYMIAAVWVMSAVTYPFMPRTIPLHWGMTGVDRWGDKTLAHVFMLPALALALYVFMLVMPRIDPKKVNLAKSAGAYNLLIDVLVGFVCVADIGMTVVTFRPELDISYVLLPALGAGVMLVGNQLGRTRQNWTLGVQVPWTMDDEEVWIKTNRLAGWLYVAAGAVQAVTPFLLPVRQAPWFAIVLVTPLVLPAVIATGYSIVVHRRLAESASPIGGGA